MSGRRWTKEENRVVKLGYNNNVRTEVIASKIDRTPVSVQHHAAILGLTKDRPHPRGMLGKHHSIEYRAKISERVKKDRSDPNSKYNTPEHRQAISDRMTITMTERMRKSPSSVYSRTHKGWAEFGDKRYYLKSGWELKYANYLETLRKGKAILDWEYEPETFWFDKIKRGVRSYTPDFKLYFPDGEIQFHEVKGWMDAKSKTKLKRMRIYHPTITVVLIDQPVMKSLGLI